MLSTGKHKLARIRYSGHWFFSQVKRELSEQNMTLQTEITQLQIGLQTMNDKYIGEREKMVWLFEEGGLVL